MSLPERKESFLIKIGLVGLVALTSGIIFLERDSKKNTVDWYNLGDLVESSTDKALFEGPPNGVCFNGTSQDISVDFLEPLKFNTFELFFSGDLHNQTSYPPDKLEIGFIEDGGEYKILRTLPLKSKPL